MSQQQHGTNTHLSRFPSVSNCAVLRSETLVSDNARVSQAASCRLTRACIRRRVTSVIAVPSLPLRLQQTCTPAPEPPLHPLRSRASAWSSNIYGPHVTRNVPRGLLTTSDWIQRGSVSVPQHAIRILMSLLPATDLVSHASETRSVGRFLSISLSNHSW